MAVEHKSSRRRIDKKTSDVRRAKLYVEVVAKVDPDAPGGFWIDDTKPLRVISENEMAGSFARFSDTGEAKISKETYGKTLAAVRDALRVYARTHLIVKGRTKKGNIKGNSFGFGAIYRMVGGPVHLPATMLKQIYRVMVEWFEKVYGPGDQFYTTSIFMTDSELNKKRHQGAQFDIKEGEARAIAKKQQAAQKAVEAIDKIRPELTRIFGIPPDEFTNAGGVSNACMVLQKGDTLRIYVEIGNSDKPYLNYLPSDAAKERFSQSLANGSAVDEARLFLNSEKSVPQEIRVYRSTEPDGGGERVHGKTPMIVGPDVPENPENWSSWKDLPREPRAARKAQGSAGKTAAESPAMAEIQKAVEKVETPAQGPAPESPIQPSAAGATSASQGSAGISPAEQELQKAMKGVTIGESTAGVTGTIGLADKLKAARKNKTSSGPKPVGWVPDSYTQSRAEQELRQLRAAEGSQSSTAAPKGEEPKAAEKASEEPKQTASVEKVNPVEKVTGPEQGLQGEVVAKSEGGQPEATEPAANAPRKQTRKTKKANQEVGQPEATEGKQPVAGAGKRGTGRVKPVKTGEEGPVHAYWVREGGKNKLYFRGEGKEGDLPENAKRVRFVQQRPREQRSLRFYFKKDDPLSKLFARYADKGKPEGYEEAVVKIMREPNGQRTVVIYPRELYGKVVSRAAQELAAERAAAERGIGGWLRRLGGFLKGEAAPATADLAAAEAALGKAAVPRGGFFSKPLGKGVAIGAGVLGAMALANWLSRRRSQPVMVPMMAPQPVMQPVFTPAGAQITLEALREYERRRNRAREQMEQIDALIRAAAQRQNGRW